MRRRRSPSCERGAALVEAALVFPLLFLIIFGIIDFGSMYNDWSSLRQGTREAARAGVVTATQPLPAGTCATTPSSVQSTGVGYNLICYTKGRIGLSAASTRVSVWFQAAGASPYFLAGNTLVVCTQARAHSLSGITSTFLSNQVMSSKVAIRIEVSDPAWTLNGGTALYQETGFKAWDVGCTTP